MIKILKSIDEQKTKIDSLLLNNPIQNPVYNYLKGLSNVKILDLGCRVPLTLMIGYHEFGSSILKGIDILESESKCIEELANRLATPNDKKSYDLAGKILKQCFTFFDFYKLNFSDESKFNKGLMNEKEFDQLITSKFEFNRSIEDFVEINKQKFDLIICNNVLHFTNQSQNLISKIAPMLEEDGIIFIRVENQPKTKYERDYFIEELNENFNIGTVYEKNKNKDWHNLTFINLPLSYL